MNNHRSITNCSNYSNLSMYTGLYTSDIAYGESSMAFMQDTGAFVERLVQGDSCTQC